MKRPFLILFFQTLFVGGIAFAQPKLEIIGGPERHFGVVKAYMPLYDTLRVKNTGTGILHIIGIIPTCGCTTALADTNIVPAGTIVRILVKIIPPDLPGKLRKTIVLQTNDLRNPEQVIAFNFQIWRELEFSPTHTLAFAGCRVNTPCIDSIVITNVTDSASFTIIGSTVNMAGLRSLMRDNISVAPHKSIVYRLELMPEAEGYRTGHFKIYTSSALTPVEDYDVFANVGDENGNPPAPPPIIFNENH